MQNKIIVTNDGSHSILSEKFGVGYHSIHGAIQETYHVFIDAGLKHIKSENKKLNILEIGWGTGLNSLVTWLESANIKNPIHYTTYEAFPIDLEKILQLNYSEKLNAEDRLEKLHLISWNEPHELSPDFIFEKRLEKFQTISDKEVYDLIYFDAFAPNAQPEFWQEEFLCQMYDSLKHNGILVTYCAKGSFKRALKAVGFQVEKLPGPPGKREMTRAAKVS